MTITDDFLAGLKEIETCPPLHSFTQRSFVQNGYASYVTYQRNELSVEFMFGPSDWDIELIVQTPKGRFAFKDLLSIKEISDWVNANRYQYKKERIIKHELMWFVALLNFSLPFIE